MGRSLRSYLSRGREGRNNRLVSSRYRVRSSRSRSNSKDTTTKARFFNIIIELRLVLFIIYTNIIIIKFLNRVEDNI